MQSFELNKSDIQRVRQALQGDDESLTVLLEEYHASEIAIIFEKLSADERQRIINILPLEVASEVIAEMDAELHPERLLDSLHPEKLSDIVEELDYDDATDLLGQLSQERQEEILEDLDAEDAHHIRKLLNYPDDSAGGLMNTQFIKISSALTKKEAIDEIIRQSEEMEEFYTVYVIDPSDRLIGLVSLKDIIKSKYTVHIRELVRDEYIYVFTDTDQEEVARLLSQYNLTAIPVVDHDMHLLGRITFDDVMDVLEEENTEDILKISGVSEDEQLSGNWVEAVKSRLPWLIVNLGTAFLASSVIRYFEPTISRLVILSGYMTMIAGMGGQRSYAGSCRYCEAYFS